MAPKILSANQLLLLDCIKNEKKITDSFYLSGGTALNAFYVPYRYSEDLDFFSENEIDPLSISAILKKLQGKIGYKKIDYQSSFNRNIYFLHLPKEVLKIEFTFYPFAQINKPEKHLGIRVDSLLDIAVNKIFTITQNPRTRDFIDIYKITEKTGWKFNDLAKKARIKFDWQIDPVNLGTQLLKVKIIKDYPRTIEKIDDKKWQEYFLNLARDIGNKQILE